MLDRGAPLPDILRDIAKWNTEIYLFEKEALGEAADRLTLYETALHKLQEAAAGYVHPDRKVTAEQLIDLVLATVDDGELVRALNAGQRPPGL